MPLEPTTPKEIADAVRAHPRIQIVGRHTKPRLAAPQHGMTLLTTRRISGITEYDPDEFTFTALAGTPMRDIVATLAGEGQYLPFDPVFSGAGATLGGTVASGLNGPGRLRFGGIRDFILAVRFVDGRGELLRGGAKVVKNAAGFDFPKFLAGSLGRFGVLVEITFKVFPCSTASTTLRIPVERDDVSARLAEGASGRWELDALNYDPSQSAIYARITGPAEANRILANGLSAHSPGAATLPEKEADDWWKNQTEFNWASGHEFLAKVPMTIAKLTKFLAAMHALPGCQIHISAAGSTAWVGLRQSTDAQTLHHTLQSLGLRALVLRGGCAPLFIGADDSSPIYERIRDVFDPVRRFAPF